MSPNPKQSIKDLAEYMANAVVYDGDPRGNTPIVLERFAHGGMRLSGPLSFVDSLHIVAAHGGIRRFRYPWKKVGRNGKRIVIGKRRVAEERAIGRLMFKVSPLHLAVYPFWRAVHWLTSLPARIRIGRRLARRSMRGAA